MLTHSQPIDHAFLQASLQKSFSIVFPSATRLKIFISRIFKVALLFICQGSKRLYIVSAEICFAHFSLILSNRRCISATAYLEYHMLFALSTTFLNYFLLLVEVCFSHFVYLSNESEYITLISLCQHLFFIFFEHFEQFVFQLF